MKIIKSLAIIPNLPFIVVLLIYVGIKISRNTNMIEFEMEENPKITTELKDWIDKVYPKHFRLFIAVLFYSYILIELIR